jgi:BirA family biotin operon repressor/biotin-[acetyl-CoA-carboxylase] ligase
MGTFVFVTEAPLAKLSGYSLAVGVGVSRVLEGFGARLSLKWPNDLVVVESRNSLKKLGGILIEVQDLGRLRCVLVGLGLNVTGVPSEVADQATSLSAAGLKQLSPAELTEPLAGELARVHSQVCEVGFESLRGEWIKRGCFVQGRTRLTIEAGDGSVSGVYHGVSEFGALNLTTDQGLRVVHSGHIIAINLMGEGS